MTSLLQAADVELDSTIRAQLVDGAMAIMADDMPSLPLYWSPTLLFYRTTVHGLALNASTQGPFGSVEDWQKGSPEPVQTPGSWSTGGH